MSLLKFSLSTFLIAILPCLTYSMGQKYNIKITNRLYGKTGLKFLCAYNIQNYIKKYNSDNKSAIRQKIDRKEYPSDLEQTFTIIKNIEDYNLEQKKIILDCISGSYDSTDRKLLSNTYILALKQQTQ